MPHWLQENSVDLITSIATLALLLVTYLSLKAARDMADTARHAAVESARATAAAERSAIAALDAALVAQSQIKVDFDGRTIGLSSGEMDPIPTVEIRAVGDAVVVQGVRARRAFRVRSDGTLWDHATLVGEVLIPAGDTQVPTRLHRGERMHFTHPAMNEEADRLGRFILDVQNTFAEDGHAGGTRQVVVSEKS